MDESTLGRNVDRMCVRGWLWLEPDNDRRGHLITITDKGSALIGKGFPAWQQAQDEVTWFSESQAQSRRLTKMRSARRGSVKYGLPRVLMCLGFAGGWEAQRYLGSPTPRPQRVIPPGVVKRCGDPNERACAPNEVSDNTWVAAGPDLSHPGDAGASAEKEIKLSSPNWKVLRRQFRGAGESRQPSPAFRAIARALRYLLPGATMQSDDSDL
jgi:hypothetical protein